MSDRHSYLYPLTPEALADAHDFLDAFTAMDTPTTPAMHRLEGPPCQEDDWDNQEAVREMCLRLVLLRQSNIAACGDVPARAHFKIHDQFSPALRETFQVTLANLTPETLLAAYDDCVARACIPLVTTARIATQGN